MSTKDKYDRGSEDTAVPLSQANEALRPFLEDDSIESMQALAGGFRSQNYKFHTRGRTHPLVLKLTNKPKDDLETELSVMRKAGERVPVPAVLHHDFDNAVVRTNLVVMEFIEGTLLSRVEVTSRGEAERLGKVLGATLAAIHQIRFDQAGWLGVGPVVKRPFDSFVREFYSAIQEMLENPIVFERLGRGDFGALQRLIQNNWRLIEEDPLPNCLIHSDFNGKNILISNVDASVSSVLDWEFAFAGNPMVDVGNFLRFDRELPDGMEAGFVASYRASGGHLPRRHKRMAKLLDLLALLDLLTKKDHGPKTAATVSEGIRDTMARWDEF